MSTTAQIAANQSNALKSSGPKTAIGKSVSSRNATKHALLSRLPVLPHLECEADWLAHCDQIQQNLQPVGAFEEALSDRIAWIMWRMARAARQEMAWTVARQDEVRLDLPAVERVEQSSEGEGASSSNRQNTALIERLCHDSDDCNFSAEEAMNIVDLALVVAGLDLSDDEFDQLIVSCGGAPPEAETWTVAQVRRIWIAVAKRVLLTFQELYTAAIWWAASESPEAESVLRESLRRVERARRQNLLPDPAHLDLLMRYETHLDRALSRALNELQRLQAQRLGMDVDNLGAAGLR